MMNQPHLPSPGKGHRRVNRRGIVSILLLLSSVLLSGCTDVAAPTWSPASSGTFQYPTFSAHRAGPGEGVSENSALAVKNAVEQHYPFIEVDVRISPDGTLFLFHDSTLKVDNSLVEPELYGKKIASLSDRQRDAVRLPGTIPQPVPLLREILEIVSGGDSHLQLDLKGDQRLLVDSIVPLLRTMGVVPKVFIHCDTLDTLEYVKSHYPDVHTLTLCSDMQQLERAITLHSEVVELIDKEEVWVTKSVVQTAHDGGVIVLFNTLSDRKDFPEHWQVLLQRGIDVLLTDHPQSVRQMLQK